MGSKASGKRRELNNAKDEKVDPGCRLCLVSVRVAKDNTAAKVGSDAEHANTELRTVSRRQIFDSSRVRSPCIWSRKLRSQAKNLTNLMDRRISRVSATR